MKWKILAVGVACLLASACVPPPAGPSHNFVVSYVAPNHGLLFPRQLHHGRRHRHQHRTKPGDYTVHLVASSGESVIATASDVLAGQTAIWSTAFADQVTVSETGVTSSSSSDDGPVPAAAMITSQEHKGLIDFGDGTEVKGTVTNTGTAPGSFVVELQANTGEVTFGTRSDVAAGQTGTWLTIFHGAAIARIIRITAATPVA